MLRRRHGPESPSPTVTDVERCTRERIRGDLARIETGATPLTVSRPEIVSSWQASFAAGLRPDRLVVPFEGVVDLDKRLVRAARPTTDQLAIDLAHTDVAIVVSDARGRVVTRHSPSNRTDELDQLRLNPGHSWRLETAGTTALGIATSARHPVVVDGPEHFMDALSALTTASAPIQDGNTARLLGAVTLVCPATSAHALLLPVAGQVAREIECRLRGTRHSETGNSTQLHARRPSFGWDSLTDAEHSLVHLIAEGLTNKEAGAELFVSRHTVDSHLRHIFRKLGINSRVELARIAAVQGVQDVARRAVA